MCTSKILTMEWIDGLKACGAMLTYSLAWLRHGLRKPKAHGRRRLVQGAGYRRFGAGGGQF